MSGLRDRVLEILVGDSEMNGYGYDADSLYPAFGRDGAPETVEGRTFGIIRWGITERGYGRVNATSMELWLYNKDRFYSPIEGGLKRARALLAPMEATQVSALENAWVVGVEWQGAGPDGFDDLYQAVVRSESYRFTASGN